MQNNRFNILIVDDEALQVMAIQSLLESEGYKTFTASSACETLEILKNTKIDIVLLDINLGDENGIQLLNIIKPKEKLDNPFVILISAHEYDDFFIEQAIKEGADGYIQKPYAEELLLARMKIFSRVKHQEEELIKTQHRLETMIESSIDGILVVNKAGKIVFANKSAEKIFGRKKDDLAEFILPAPPSGNEPIETDVIRPGGEDTMIEIRFSPINWDNEEMQLATIRDITEMNRIRAKLRKSERFYRMLTEKNLDGILMLDKTGKIIYAPSNACNILGINREELTGMSFDFFIHTDYLENYRSVFSEVLAKPGNVGKVTWKFITPAKKEMWLEGNFQNLFSDPDFKSVLVNFRDVTEITLSKEEIRNKASETQLIYDAGKLLNHTINLEEIFDRFFTIVSGIMEVNDMVITMYDDIKQEVSFACVWDNRKKDDVSGYPKIKLDLESNGAQAKAIKNDKAYIINNYVEAVKESSFVFITGKGLVNTKTLDYEAQVAKSALVCPLHTKDRITGVIQIYSYNFNSYTESDLRILQAISNNLAVVIVNATLYENIQKELAERKRVEKELRLSEDRFNAFMRNLPANAWISDKEHRLLYDNNFSHRKNPAGSKDVIGKTPYEIIDKDIADDYIRNSDIVIQSGEPIEVIESAYRQDGALGSFLVYKFPFYSPDGELYIGGISIDITERLRQEEDLKKALKEKQSAEERFRQFMDHVPAIAWITDKHHKVLYTNQILFLLKVKSKNVLNRNINELFDEETCKIYVKNSEKVLETGKGIEVIETATRKDGSKGSFLVYKFPLKSTSGEPLVGAIAFDITDRLSMENSLKAGIHEKENLLREIHHRVKNNLQIVSSLLNLQSGIAVKDPAEFIILAQSRVRSMAIIHEQLYKSANLNNINFKKYAAKLISHLFSVYGNTGKKIDYEIISDEILLDIENAIPIGLITNELVSNSLKYAFSSNGGGTITIKMEQFDKDYYKLTVKDNGIGLPEDFSVKNLSSLGLSLVDMLVNQLDGKLEIRNNNGSEFQIVFKKMHYKPRNYGQPVN